MRDDILDRVGTSGYWYRKPTPELQKQIMLDITVIWNTLELKTLDMLNVDDDFRIEMWSLLSDRQRACYTSFQNETEYQKMFHELVDFIHNYNRISRSHMITAERYFVKDMVTRIEEGARG